MADAPEVTLGVAGVGKDYAGPVLADVALDLRAGEVLALTGANGAGKSTLSKILAGVVAPSRGRMVLGGAPYAPADRREAEARGVKMVMQELNLLPNLSVAENLFLHRLPHRAGWIRRGALRAAAREAMAAVGLDAIDPDTPVGELGLGFRQMVEIARSLIGEARVLILDEPTAALTGREADLLFARIAELKARGVAIVYISHRLEEVARIADRVAVLRDGRLVSLEPMARTSTEAIIVQMVGRGLDPSVRTAPRAAGPPRLRVRGLGRGDAVRDVSFEVRSGEVFGLFGLVGAGRTELLRLIYGADRPDRGVVEIGDPPRPVAIRSPADAVRAGMAMIPEDRKGEGLLLPLSVATNLTLGNLSAVSSGGLVGPRRERAAAADKIRALGIRADGPDQPVEALSGGNQQKVVIGRALDRAPSVVLFDEPTRGVDVGAKQDVYGLIEGLVRSGAAVVVVSSELAELALVCDRIAVVSAGRLVADFGRGEWTEEALLAAAFSGYVRRDDALAQGPQGAAA